MAVEQRYAVKAIRDVRIPMPDGVRLAANLFMPEVEGTWPAIFAFTPYLKDGRGGLSHEPHHRYFASRGYATLQVDFRGTGGSEGINPYPFDTQEREDGHHVVEWLAAQPWCTGAVGVWGISYGGITSLSIASTRPPHLRAIVPIHATVDNYEWLMRTHGCRGLLLGDMDWSTRMAANNLTPPILQDPDGDWHRRWRQRLEANTPWITHWHGQPPDPEFWERRKIPYERINVPTFGICGWYDAYTEPTFMVYSAVQAPKRVLIGPWKHALADLSPMDPIGGVHEMDRWWDRWLKDIDTGVEREPPVTIFIMGANTWRHETEWPIARTQPTRLYAAAHGKLALERADASGADDYAYDSRVGTGSIGYNGHRLGLAIPPDQSADDHLSLCYTGEPLTADTEITGQAIAHVFVSATVEECNVVAKLCVVDQAGRSRVLGQGVANPARVDAHTPRRPLRSNEPREVIVRIHPTSRVLCAGERLRLCLAGADFPEIWPTPQPYTLTVQRGGQYASYVEVPIVPPRADPLPPPNLQPARDDLAPPALLANEERHVVLTDLAARAVSFETRSKIVNQVGPATTMTNEHHAIVATDADRPWTTSLRTETRIDLERPVGVISTQTASVVTPFAVHVTAKVTIDGQPFFERAWTKEVDDWTDPTRAHPGRGDA